MPRQRLPSIRPLPQLALDEPFPLAGSAWGENEPIPGLLCLGADLSVPRLVDAYRHGIFPWFSEGDPILWWSPDPRMVLQCDNFRLHRSLKKTLKRFAPDTPGDGKLTAGCEIRIDSDFAQTIALCAGTPREGQSGTWILPEMQAAYTDFHTAGFAHSVETWVGNKLVGGLYCTNVGGAVFGESMFSHVSDASKIALAALVAVCRKNRVAWIDCQQQTAHLQSLGAAPVPRAEFLRMVDSALAGSEDDTQAESLNRLDWSFSPADWAWVLE